PRSPKGAGSATGPSPSRSGPRWPGCRPWPTAGTNASTPCRRTSTASPTGRDEAPPRGPRPLDLRPGSSSYPRPMEGLTIARAAEETGFTPSALRFYEGLGLVNPARTPAGYRTYGPDSLAVLRFIARAKRLGLS